MPDATSENMTDLRESLSGRGNLHFHCFKTQGCLSVCELRWPCWRSLNLNHLAFTAMKNHPTVDGTPCEVDNLWQGLWPRQQWSLSQIPHAKRRSLLAPFKESTNTPQRESAFVATTKCKCISTNHNQQRSNCYFSMSHSIRRPLPLAFVLDSRSSTTGEAVRR